MTISFKYLPASTIRIPGVFVEIDPSRANTGLPAQRGLVIGQVNSGATLATGTPIICQGVANTQQIAGNGSMLALMVEQWRKSDPFGELWMLPLAADGSAVVATGTVQFTAAATAAGTYVLYIGGQRVLTLVTSGMTTSQLATALAAAVNAMVSLPVTAGASTATVTMTAKNLGAAANDITLTENFLGAAGGEIMPTGVATTIVAMASGATNPSLTTPLLNCGTMTFDFIALPYIDSTSIASMNSFLHDATGRWAWNSELYGQAFTGYRGTYGALVTFGLTQNGNHISTMGFYNSMSPYWLWAADVAAACAVSARANPVVPLTQIAMNVWAPPVASRFVPSDRDTLLHDGISTFTVGADGVPYIERMVTNYQLNPASAPDTSWLDVETNFTAMASLRDMRTFLQSAFARKVLVSDSTRISDQSSVTTARDIRSAITARYRYQESLGLVQNSDKFSAGLIAENAGNGQVRVLAPFDWGNQLRQIAMLVAFQKS